MNNFCRASSTAHWFDLGYASRRWSGNTSGRRWSIAERSVHIAIGLKDDFVFITRANSNEIRLTSVEPLGKSGFAGEDCAAIIGLPESMPAGFPGTGGIMGIGGRMRAIICTGIMDMGIVGIPKGMPGKAMGIIGGAVIIPRGGMGGIPMGVGAALELPVSESSLSLPASRFSCSRRSSSGMPSMP